MLIKVSLEDDDPIGFRTARYKAAMAMIFKGHDGPYNFNHTTCTTSPQKPKMFEAEIPRTEAEEADTYAARKYIGDNDKINESTLKVQNDKFSQLAVITLLIFQRQEEEDANPVRFRPKSRTKYTVEGDRLNCDDYVEV